MIIFATKLNEHEIFDFNIIYDSQQYCHVSTKNQGT